METEREIMEKWEVNEGVTLTSTILEQLDGERATLLEHKDGGRGGTRDDWLEAVSKVEGAMEIVLTDYGLTPSEITDFWSLLHFVKLDAPTTLERIMEAHDARDYRETIQSICFPAIQ